MYIHFCQLTKNKERFFQKNLPVVFSPVKLVFTVESGRKVKASFYFSKRVVKVLFQINVFQRVSLGRLIFLSCLVWYYTETEYF